jgi:hypothetical protein
LNVAIPVSELSDIADQIVGSTQLSARFAILQIRFAQVCIYELR